MNLNDENTLPNFLVIGAMKCGTTSLCHYLNQHPEVFVADMKETHYFGEDNVYSKGIEWYKAHFKAAQGKKAIGEGSVIYTIKSVYPNAAKRIRQDLGSAIKLIYIVRHPFERITSNWEHFYVAGFESQSFEDSIRNNPLYLDASDYQLQLDEYRKYFPDQQILVLFFEDLKKEPERVLARCFEFLGVDAEVKIDNVRHIHNNSQDRYGDRWFIKAVQKFPLWIPMLKFATSHLPVKFIRLLYPVVKWRMKNRPVINDNLHEFLERKLRQSSERFLETHGKPADYWKWG